MAARIEIVKGVEYNAKLGKPVNIELRVFDVSMMGCYLDISAKLAGNLFCDLALIRMHARRMDRGNAPATWIF